MLMAYVKLGDAGLEDVSILLHVASAGSQQNGAHEARGADRSKFGHQNYSLFSFVGRPLQRRL
jgi:hypothetical protein